MKRKEIRTALPTRVLLVACLAISIAAPTRLMARDIAIDITGQEAREATQNGGFLELGIGFSGGRRLLHQPDESQSEDFSLGISLNLSTGYRYNRFFIEATESSFDGLNAGFTLVNSGRWTVDFLLANLAGSVTVVSDAPPPPETEQERNEAILDRDSLFIAAGARVTGYFGDNIVQFRLVSDWYDDNGISASARVGRQWQVGNLNFQALGGVRYHSQDFSQYLYGVSEEEQSVRFPAYDADDALIPEAEIGLRIPLGKDWVYSNRLRYRYYPETITDSPLVANNSDVTFNTALLYVF